MSFREFLKTAGIDDDNFDATSETLSFTNKNGKKFVYPIEDLDLCLLALWSASESVEASLGADWRYEESKFRRAFGTAFENQRANTAVSNLGSQTPNTVRCLELYAYYRLGKTPTPRLAKPEILRGKNLDALFYGEDRRDEFRNWLQVERDLASKSAESYVGAVAGLLSSCAAKDLFLIKSIATFNFLRTRIITHPEFLERDKTGNQMYSSALKQYSAFLEKGSMQKLTGSSALSPSLLLSQFSAALESAGFKVSQ